MKKPRRPPKPGKRNAQTKSYLDALIQMLEALDFEQAQRAAQALGEAADASAIQPLMTAVKGSAALRAAAIVALKKMAQENDQAATELAIALMAEKGEEVGVEAGVRPIAPADRRRSPRVLLELPVLVTWQDESGQPQSELTTTKIVNAYGALLTLKSPVTVGLELELTNRLTQAKVPARVAWLGSQSPSGGGEVGIELGNPIPEFWVGKLP